MDTLFQNAGTAAVRSRVAFETLLSRLTQLSSKDSEILSITSAFCQEIREFFGCSGVFCWEKSGNELVGLAANGIFSQRFRGMKLSLDVPSLARDAVLEKRPIFLKNGPENTPSLSGVVPAGTALALPLLFAGTATGALVLVADANATLPEDAAAQLNIVSALFAQTLELLRMRHLRREETWRTDLLVECANRLHSDLDRSAVASDLVANVSELLRADVVLLYRRDPQVLRLLAASSVVDQHSLEEWREKTSTSTLMAWIRSAESQERPSAFELTGTDLELALGTGQVLIAPLRLSNDSGALLVYSGSTHIFNEAEIASIHAIAGFGGLALSNAELLENAKGKTAEVQQLIDICSDLATISDLDVFLEKFVVKVAQFLGFQRSFIATADGNDCFVRWISDEGSAQPLVVPVPTSVMESLRRKEIFWTNDASSSPGFDLSLVERFNLHQGIAAPLLGSDGRLLGALGALDRRDGNFITPEDLRRANALAAEVAVVLESTQNLHLSNQHRKRAENLMELALELSSSLRLPDLVQSFTTRAASMLHARAAAVALARGSSLETIFLHEPNAEHDHQLLRRLNFAFSQIASRHLATVVHASAVDLLGADNVFGWSDVTLVRLTSANDELIGLLCLADRDAPLTSTDESLLQAIGGHASVALENSRMFSRMSQANRHWVEIFDAISDLIVVHDESNTILRVNRSMAEFVGTRPQEIIGVSMRALMAMAGEQSPLPCPFCRTSRNDSDESVQSLMERSYLVSTSRIHGGNNEGPQTVHVMKDITDRREAERRYRELFDNIQEGLFFSTPQGRFVEVNDALVRILGYSSREELLQVDIPQALYLNASTRSEFSRAIEKDGILRNFEEVLRKKDGSLIHTLQNAFAVRDSEGRIVQYRGLILDITDQKNFQTELQRQRDFNLKILNNTQSLILVLDTAGLISYGNRRCYEAGCYTQEELMGRPMAELVPPNRRQSFLDALYATVTGQQVDNLEMAMQRGDGRIGQFSINLSPMRDEQGNVTSIVVVMTDITDAAVLQAKLMHTEKLAAVGQLVSGVAHEVNNPLTAILGFADLMAGDQTVPEAAKRDLGVIIQEAQRTKQIVQNLLSFARQTPPQRQSVQLNTILRRTLQLRAYDFANHGVEVIQHLEDSLPEVIGDSHQLQQVFLNIVNNAYDAVMGIGRPGRIEIFSTFRDGYVAIHFVDNGTGITAPDRIFDPFFTTKEVGKGTGLGLSICYGIVREHGGDISCHNNVSKAGATFIVRLPVVQPEAALSSMAVQGAS